MFLDILLGERKAGLFNSIEFIGGGFMSIQANEGINCEPRVRSESSEVYSEFEVMAGGLDIKTWNDYESSEPGLYYNVPRHLIEQEIRLHDLKNYYDQEVVETHGQSV